MSKLWGAIEGGGSKFICAVGTGFDDIRAEATIPTADPESTLRQVVAFFAPHRVDLAALGLCTFGPLELDPLAGDRYGALLRTPKPGWSGLTLRALLHRELGLPVSIETDVNGAALAEQRNGQVKGLSSLVYVTVGTGVGVGVVIDGKPLHGLLHPEFGHMRVPRLPGDAFPGICPFHGDCVEGLISVPAIRARAGSEPVDLADGDPLWEGVAQTLAWLMHNIVLAYSPQRIVLGGGLLQRAALWPRLLTRCAESLSGYVPRDATQAAAIAQYIVRPSFGMRAGLAGAFEVALTA